MERLTLSIGWDAFYANYVRSYLERDVWFYRDARKREIDPVIQDGRVLHPVEIKIGAQIGTDAVRNFQCLNAFGDYEVGFGHVVCQTPEPYLVARDVQAIPVWAI